MSDKIDTRGRTVSVELIGHSEEEWQTLRRVALQAARWANKYMTMETYHLLNQTPPDARKAARREFWAIGNDELGAMVRMAMSKRVRATMQRSAKDMAAGRVRSAQYSGDRALSVACDPSNPGAIFLREGDEYVLLLRVIPDRTGCGELIRDDEGEPLLGSPGRPIRLKVNRGAGKFEKSPEFAGRIDAIWSAMESARKAGPWTAGQLHLVFERQRGKLLARIAYNHPIPPGPVGEGPRATLGPLNTDGELWLRMERDETGQQALNFAHVVRRLWKLKAEWEGRTHRLRRRSGRARGRRKAYLREAARRTFSDRATAEMEALTCQIARHCRGQGVRLLEVATLGDRDLPWHDFRSRLEHKCVELGIEVVDGFGAKAQGAEVGKRQRKLQHARRGVRAARELMV